MTPRYAVHADAVWSTGRSEGRCRIRTLSWGGATISDLLAPLRPGERLQVTIVAGGWRGTASVKVVHITGEGLGLQFLRIEDDLRRALDELFAGLTPLD